MRERDIEQYFIKRWKEIGGEVRKVKWLDRRGAPDRVAFLPYIPAVWVEFKAPGIKIDPHQEREHNTMLNLNQMVVVIDSFELVDALISDAKGLQKLGIAKISTQ